MAKINFGLQVTNNKPATAQKQLDKGLFDQIMHRGLFGGAQSFLWIGGFRTTKAVNEGYEEVSNDSISSTFASEQVEGKPIFEVPTADGTRKPAAGEKKLIDDLFKKYETFDVEHASRENLEVFIKEVTEALEKVKDIKGLDKKIPNAVALREKLGKALERRTNKFNVRQSEGITDEQIEGIATGTTRLEDVLRLTPKNRTLYAVREIVSKYYSNEFTNNFIKQELGKDANIKGVIFDEVEIVDARGKKHVGYVLKPGFESLKSVLPTPAKYKKDDSSPEVEYYDEAATVVTYDKLVKFAQDNVGKPVQEKVQSFAAELKEQAKIEDSALNNFVNDVLDKAGIAETFGADLQQYNSFVQIPPSVLAMHAVVSSGAIDCFNAAGNFKPGGKQEYINILEKLGINSPLAKLIMQVTGRDASGNKMPVSEENKEFAQLRGKMLLSLVSTAKTYTERNSIFTDPAMLETAKRISGLQEAVIEQSFTPDEKTAFNAARDTYVEEHTESAMETIDNTMMSTIVSGLNVDDTAARLSYLNKHMETRRNAFVADVLDSVSGLTEAKKEELVERLTRSENQSILGRNGFILQNIAMIESLQNDLFITTADPAEHDKNRRVLQQYQGQERVLLGLNNAFLDMVEATEEAEIVHTIANAVKFEKLTKSEAYTTAESKEKDALEKVEKKLQQFEDAKKAAKIAEKNSLNEKIEYYCSLYQQSVETIYGAVLGGAISTKVQKQINAVLDLIRKAGLSLKPNDAGEYDFSKIEEIYKNNYEAFLSQLGTVATKQGITGKFSSAAEKYSVDEMLDKAHSGLAGIVKLTPEQITGQLEAKFTPELLKDYLSADKAKSEVAERKILEQINGDDKLTLEEKAKFKTMLSIAKETAAKQHVSKAKEELDLAKQTLQQCQKAVRDVEFEQIRLPEFKKKVEALETLLLKLETCKKKIESLDFSQFEESKLEALGFSKEDIEKIKAMDIFKVREDFLKEINEKIEQVKTTIKELKENAAENYSIQEVELEDGSGATRFVVVDDPRKQYAEQSKGYTIGSGKKSTHYDYEPEVAAIHPLVIEVADVLKRLEDEDEATRQAAQKELDEVIKPKLDEIKDEALKEKILKDIARVRRFDKGEYIVVATYTPADPDADKTEMVEPTPNHDNPANEVTEEDLREVRVTLGLEKGTVRRRTSSERERSSDVPPVVEYTAEQAKIDAEELLGINNFIELKDSGKLDAYLERVDKLVEKITPLAEKEDSLKGVVDRLKAHREVAVAARGPEVVEEVHVDADRVVEEVHVDADRVDEDVVTPPTFTADDAKREAAELLAVDHTKLEPAALSEHLEKLEKLLAKIEPLKDESLVEVTGKLTARVGEVTAAMGGVTPPVAEDVKDFVDLTNIHHLVMEYLGHPDGKRPTDERAAEIIETLAKEGLTKADIESIKAGKPTERAQTFIDQLGEIEKEALSKLESLKHRLPETEAGRTAFVTAAVDYAETTSEGIPREDIERRVLEDMTFVESLEPDLDEEIAPIDEEEAEKIKITPPTKFTTKGCEYAIKSANKALKAVNKELAAIKAEKAAMAEAEKQALLRKAYAGMLLSRVLETDKINFSEMVAITSDDAYETAEDGLAGDNPVYDSRIVVQYLQGVRNSTFDPETGALVNVGTDGKKVGVEDAIYDIIETGDKKPKELKNRRQRVIHKHLHTIATRENMLKGAQLIGDFLKSKGIEVSESKITALMNNELEGIKWPDDFVEAMQYANECLAGREPNEKLSNGADLTA